jgi:tRNA/rRNA methyltransferase
MTSEQRARVAVVLVRARNPQNIGAVARAMHDFGFTDLRMVNEYPVPFQAAKSAVDASSVLESAQEYTGIAHAISDCTLVLGTTAVGDRVLEHPLYGLAEAGAPVTAALASGGRVALLFGSEKTGLSNEELSHCHALVTIPMHVPDGKHLSMNLGQAAAVCLYGLGQVEPVAAMEPAAANAGEVERLTALFSEVLSATGYARRYPANAREASVRRMVRRMGLRPEDAAVWMGLLRQVMRAVAKDGKAEADLPRD